MVHVLNTASNAVGTGDKSLLLFHQASVPTAVGNNRIEAGKALFAVYPELRLIVADDGLQHYALQYDMETAVFPATDTGRINLDLLSNDSSHEPLSRLASADAAVVSGRKTDAAFRPSENMFASHTETGWIYRSNRSSEGLDFVGLGNQTVTVVTGIAEPECFFDSLRNMGITLNQTVVLPDYADIAVADLPNMNVVIITERDTVKSSDNLNLDHAWVLLICAIVEPNSAMFVSAKVPT